MLATLFFLALVFSQEVSIYSQQLGASQNADFGRIVYDAGANTATFMAGAMPQGQFCLGTRDLAGKDCFSYHETEKLSGQFSVYVTGGQIEDISFASDFDEESNISVVVLEADKAPVPKLSPAVQPVMKPPTKKTIRRRLVENDDGEQVEIEEEIEEVVEVDNRSWIQKNWMYVVPPLVLFLIMSPEK